MNMFQILDKDGKAIDINALDQEACILWGTKLDKKSYASPYDKSGVYDKYMSGEYTYGSIKVGGETSFYAARENWFDQIGWRIAQGNTAWTGLKDDLLEVYKKYDIPEEDIKADPRVWGFIELIDLWESKGYVAVSMDGDYNILSKNGIGTATPEEPTDQQQQELDMLSAANSVDVSNL